MRTEFAFSLSAVLKKWHQLLLIIFVLPTAACTGSAYKLPAVSHSEIAQIEAEVAADERELKVYKRSDATYKKRIASISRRLQKSAEPLCELAEFHTCKFEVRYDNEDIVNAYAHENYKITVHKGLLKYLKNNDEMAALVAHEMGHHLANHNEETRKNAETGAVVSGVLTAVLVGMANANNPYYDSYQQQRDQEAIESMMAVGAEIGKLSYSKDQEREADLLAAYLMEHAGYDLEKGQNLLYTMAKISGDDVPGKAALMDTHPPSTERVAAWRKAIDEIDANEEKLPYLKAPK